MRKDSSHIPQVSCSPRAVSQSQPCSSLPWCQLFISPAADLLLIRSRN